MRPEQICRPGGVWELRTVPVRPILDLPKESRLIYGTCRVTRIIYKKARSKGETFITAPVGSPLPYAACDYAAIYMPAEMLSFVPRKRNMLADNMETHLRNQAMSTADSREPTRIIRMLAQAIINSALIHGVWTRLE